MDSTRDINNAIITRQDTGGRLRRTVREPRRIGRLSDHDCRRHRRDGARHAHRRRPSRSRAMARRSTTSWRRRWRPTSPATHGRWRPSASATSSSSKQAVTESRTYTEQEALEAKPPLIDLVANDVPDLLKKLDGRTITRFDGRTEVLRTAGAATHAVSMTWSQRVLSALAHPQIAYLLLTLGTLGLTIELWSPGRHSPGRGRRPLPAAGVFRASSPARELRRACC